MSRTIDIFVKSYKPDFWLLQLSLESIRKNVRGYANIVLLIPEKDKDSFDTRSLPDRTQVHYIEDKQPGWLYQQWCKMNAHKYCFSEFIMFSDSDIIYEHPIDLQELVTDGKPEILYTDYEQLPDAKIWKEPTEKFIKESVKWEFMRRLPLIYYRATLVAISEYDPDLEDTILSSQRFSEFNCLGVYAFKYETHNYKFVNTDDWKYVPPLGIQVWSHASKEKGTDELHLREYIRILETLLKMYNVTLPQ